MKLQWLSPIEHLERFDGVIDRDDIDQLRLYFRLDGMSSFTKSPLGGMLDNAMLYSPNYRPCVFCGGKRHGVNEDGTAIGEDIGGRGFLVNVAKWSKDKRERYEKRAKGKCDGESHPIVDNADCVVCGTRGWIRTSRFYSKSKLTAQPRADAGIHRETSLNVDVQIGTCAIVGSILDRADVLFPLSTAALASVYGRDNYGSIGLWHLTPAGKTMLRGNSENMQPELYFANVRNKNHDQKSKNVTAQLELADEQSEWLIKTAKRSWNAAGLVYRCGV